MRHAATAVPPESLTGGQALARSLVSQGVSTVFALPGVQLDWAIDALYEIRDQTTVLHVRHEQATASMADGYARATGEPGVCMMVHGPGLLNASAGLIEVSVGPMSNVWPVIGPAGGVYPVLLA